MALGRIALAAVCLFGAGCSLLFETAESDGSGPEPDEVDVCLGRQRSYDRGAALSGDNTRFEYLDYAQGTITFWVRALDLLPEGDSAVLVDVGGITITTEANGDFVVNMPGVADPVPLEGASEWKVGDDLFLALRWDALANVSGAPGVDARLMLRVGPDIRRHAVGGSFMPGTAGAEQIIVGDDEAVFHVDQFTIYNRPLFVDSDVSDGAPDELRILAEAKQASPTLVRGGMDVSFATASSQRAGCAQFEERAWTMPLENEAPGDFRSADFTAWNAQAFNPTPVAERVYQNALAVGPNEIVTSQFELEPGKSYVYYALTHAQEIEGEDGAAVPWLAIYPMDAANRQEALVYTYSFNATAENPEAFFGTFTMPSNLARVEVELGNLADSASELAFFHTVFVRKNYVADPGFEAEPCETGPCPLSESWQSISAGDAVAEVRFADGSGIVNTGYAAACFSGTGQQNVLRPTLEGVALENDAYYAMGLAAVWGSEEGSKPPGVSGGNSGFFATGVPHELGERAGALALERERMEVVGTASYRLEGQEFNATNDAWHVGPSVSQPNDISNACVDDVYFFPLQVIPGA